MKGEYIFSRYLLIKISTAVVNLLLLILLSPYKSSRHWIFIQINTRQLHVINFPFVMLVAVAVLVVSFFLFFISPALFLLIPTIPGGLFLDHFLENTHHFSTVVSIQLRYVLVLILINDGWKIIISIYFVFAIVIILLAINRFK